MTVPYVQTISPEFHREFTTTFILQKPQSYNLQLQVQYESVIM